MANDLSVNVSPLGDKSLAMEALDNNSIRYDTAYVAAGTTYNALLALLVMFQVPKGSIGNGYTQPKRYSETNMELNGILEEYVQGTIRQAIVEIIPAGASPGGDSTLQYVAQFLQDSNFRLVCDRAEEVIEHTVVFAGGGVTGVAQPNAGVPEGWVSGQPTIIGGEEWPVTTGILPNAPFRVEIVPNQNAVPLAAAVPNAFFVRVNLLGSFTRPVYV